MLARSLQPERKADQMEFQSQEGGQVKDQCELEPETDLLEQRHRYEPKTPVIRL